MTPAILAALLVASLAATAFFAGCEAARSGLPDEARPGRAEHALGLGRSMSAAGAVAAAVGLARVAGPGWAPAVAGAVAIAVALAVLGELVPRALGAERPEAWIRRGRPVRIAWRTAVAPLAGLASRLAAAGRASDLTRPAAAVSIFEFGETTVREVMTPRPDVVAVQASAPWDEARARILESGYSRIPVYGEDLDAVVGILYAKDLLPVVHLGRRLTGGLAELVREAEFVPEAKRIDELLRDFQRQRLHLAVVVDEYGGVAGIVTLEDVVEELVGEIQDERDREDPRITVLRDGMLRVDGGLDTDDFNEATGSRFETGDVETIGGLVARELGRVAEGGEEVEIDGWRFRVDEVDGKRIARLRASPLREAGPEGDG